MKPAKTIFFAVLLLTVVYSATKVHGGGVQAVAPEPLNPTAVCVACSQPSQVSIRAFPTRQKGNVKLLEERLRTLYPKP
jgi:hypothetical protein